MQTEEMMKPIIETVALYNPCNSIRNQSGGSMRILGKVLHKIPKITIRMDEGIAKIKKATIPPTLLEVNIVPITTNN